MCVNHEMCWTSCASSHRRTPTTVRCLRPSLRRRSSNGVWASSAFDRFPGFAPTHTPSGAKDFVDMPAQEAGVGVASRPRRLADLAGSVKTTRHVAVEDMSPFSERDLLDQVVAALDRATAQPVPLDDKGAMVWLEHLE